MNQQDIADDIATGYVAVIGCLTTDPDRNPIAGSTPTPCRECDEDVMLAPATRQRMTELSIVLCVECAVAVAKVRNQPWIDAGRSVAQLQEMKDNGIEPRR